MIGGGAVLRGSFEDLTAKTTLADAHSSKMHALPRLTLSQDAHLSHPYRFLSPPPTVLPLPCTAQQASNCKCRLSRCQLTVILPDPCNSRMSSTHRGFLTEAAPLSVYVSDSGSTSLSSSLSIYLALSHFSLLAEGFYSCPHCALNLRSQ